MRIVPSAVFIAQLVYGINAADTSEVATMARTAVAVLALVLFTFCAFDAQVIPQQRNRGVDLAIRGKVVIGNGGDVGQRVEVRVKTTTMQLVQTTYTDGGGGFEFRHLAPGSYFIAVSADGYESARQQVEVFNNFGASNVTIFLGKSAADPRSRLSGLDAEDRDVIDISQMKENLPKKAVQEYEKAIDEKKRGKLENAVKLLESAVRLAPNFYHAHNNLGSLYQSLKRYPEAEKEYTRSRELNAKSERPLVNLGSLYIEEAELQKEDAELTGRILDQALDALDRKSTRLNSSHITISY